MAFLKAINGDLTLPGIQIRVNEGDVITDAPAENVSGPGMSNGDRTDHDFGNKRWIAQLRGVAESNGFVRAVGGSFTSANMSMGLSSGRIRKTWPLDNVTGPGDAGVVKWCEGIPTYTAAIRGWATGDVFEASDTDPQGTLTIQPGASNEQLSGTAILRRRRVQNNYRRGSAIPVAVDAIYKNDASVTSGDANLINNVSDGTLTVQVGDSGGTHQELSGACKVRTIEFEFDMATGMAIPVNFEARWNVDPTA